MDAYVEDAELTTTEDGRQERTRGPPAPPALLGPPVANRNEVDGRQPFMDASVSPWWMYAVDGELDGPARSVARLG